MQEKMIALQRLLCLLLWYSQYGQPSELPVLTKPFADTVQISHSIESVDFAELPGGTIRIGIMDKTAKHGEYPARQVIVHPFMIDYYPVTNADFRIFKMAKRRYQTEAELAGDSYVFYSHVLDRNAVLRDKSTGTEPWWFAVKAARWDQPEGPGSDLRHRDKDPVVHVGYHDAQAYCQWHGKRLPTEPEWEFAARGGEVQMRYPWGEHFEPNRMNTWQGLFPSDNNGADGWPGISPVNAYAPQNEYGMYDMVGNTWEWTSSKYFDPKTNRLPPGPIRLIVKGGSFVDSRDGQVNLEARCAARMPVSQTRTAQNIGFRCAKPLPYVDPHAKMTTKKPKPRREPRVHHYNETWKYKMEQVMESLAQDNSHANREKNRPYVKYRQDL